MPPRLLSSSVVGFLGVFLLACSAAAQSSDSEKKEEQKSKKVYTNEDLSRLKGTQRVNQASSSQASKSKSNVKGIDDYRDKNGHDRNYWHQKVQPLRNRLEALDTQIASLEAKRGRLNATSGVKVTRSGKMRASSSDTRVQLDKRIDDLSREKNEVVRSLQDMEEEARKAGALPEWLR
jgi:hypothetical protein